RSLRARVRRARGRLPVGAAEDRPDPRGRVLQVGAGVAAERDHPVPVEDIRAFPRGRQVGVLDRADADGLGDRVKLGGIETCRGVELDQDAARAVNGLLQQVAELDVFSGPRPETVAVRSEDQAYLS